MLKSNEQLFLELMKKANIPGLSVASVVNGKFSECLSLGITDNSLNPAITVNSTTVFEAASLSKPVFAYIVLKMIGRGELSKSGEPPEKGLDRPLHEIADFGPPHLRDHPYYKLLTARLVLTHRTGLPNWGKPNEPINFKFKPGEQYGYSGQAITYLQEVIEKQCGMGLDKLAKNELPLEMTHRSFYRPQDLTIAVRHDEEMNPQPLPTDNFKPAAYAACSLHTTAKDYALFIAAWMSDKTLQYAFDFDHNFTMIKDKWAVEQKVSNDDLQKVTWGLGWGLQKTNQGTIAFHWGDMGDSKAFVAINLQTKAGIVFFANSCNGLAIAHEIISSTIGDSIGDLSPGFNYLFGKFGYQRHNKPGWIERQKLSVEIFGKYELDNKPGWENLLSDRMRRQLIEGRASIANQPDKITLTNPTILKPDLVINPDEDMGTIACNGVDALQPSLNKQDDSKANKLIGCNSFGTTFSPRMINNSSLADKEVELAVNAVKMH